jgi:gamma-glutamyltranspeptidase
MTHVQLLLNMLVFGMDPQIAVDRPRWGAQRIGGGGRPHAEYRTPDRAPRIREDVAMYTSASPS